MKVTRGHGKAITHAPQNKEGAKTILSHWEGSQHWEITVSSKEKQSGQRDQFLEKTQFLRFPICESLQRTTFDSVALCLQSETVTSNMVSTG